MKYNDNTFLKISYGNLKELLYYIQKDGIDSDGGAWFLVFDDLDPVIENGIENEKTISVIE